MPMPQPSAGESQKDWMDRCMGNPTMKEEFPETDQRVAVCMRTWRESKSSTAKYTRYHLPLTRFDTQAVTDGKHIVGHAAVFNRLSEDRGGYFVMMQPGAFTRSIAEDDVRALFNHDPNYVIGRTKNGTLKLSEDEIGLAIDIAPPDTQFARDLVTLIERGDVTQMSIGGIIRMETRVDDEDASVFVVRDMQLWDVSPVVYPAFDQTDVSVASMAVLHDFANDSKPAQNLRPAALLAARKRALSLVGVTPKRSK